MSVKVRGDAGDEEVEELRDEEEGELGDEKKGARQQNRNLNLLSIKIMYVTFMFDD